MLVGVIHQRSPSKNFLIRPPPLQHRPFGDSPPAVHGHQDCIAWKGPKRNKFCNPDAHGRGVGGIVGDRNTKFVIKIVRDVSNSPVRARPLLVDPPPPLDRTSWWMAPFGSKFSVKEKTKKELDVNWSGAGQPFQMVELKRKSDYIRMKCIQRSAGRRRCLMEEQFAYNCARRIKEISDIR